MTDLIPAIRFDQDIGGDALKPFVLYLSSVNFPHRLSEESGRLVLWVYHKEHVAMARTLYQRFERGEIAAEFEPVSKHSTPALAKITGIISQNPVAIMTLLLSVIGYTVVVMGLHQVVAWLSFQGIFLSSPDAVISQIVQGQVWRLVTPIFLHFSWVHIGFNAVIFWFLGHQVERREGSWALLTAVLLFSLASNITQFYLQPYHLFGGLSGVVYGLIAYCWLRNTSQAGLFNFPSGLAWLSVAMILIGFTGVSAFFGFNLANWAHLAGFAMGAVLALFKRGKGFGL